MSEKNEFINYISYKEGKEGKKILRQRIVKDFCDMGLKVQILKGIFGKEFKEPSQIQSIAILPLISNPPVDMSVQSKWGTGKSTTFMISMLQNLSDESKDLQGLVLAPTREIALQIYIEFLALSCNTKFKIHCCVGGTKVQDDIDKLREGVNIVIGTPGRIMHMVKSNHLMVNNLRMFVIDEADVLFTKGFKDQLYELFKDLNQNTQLCLFSETMPSELVDLSEKFLRDPLKIVDKKKFLEGIQDLKHYYVNILKESDKFPTLLDLFKYLNNPKAIIFANSKKKVDELADKMKENNFTVSKFHSGLKDDREKVLKEFTTGSTRILISTDLVQGIDLVKVSLVINYDFPREKEVFYTRISVTERKGTSINFINIHKKDKQKEFERFGFFGTYFLLFRYYQLKIKPLPKEFFTLKKF